jgi:hypothetical protein
MIYLPRRSVTRFFIPLIDVLTVLFCIFLLMPLIRDQSPGDRAREPEARNQRSDAASPLSDRRSVIAGPRQDNPDAEHLQRVRNELEMLQRQKIETLQQRLLVRVLEIDADSGKLYATEGGDRFEIANQAEAIRLITRHRQEAGNKEVYYLFLFPRRLTGFPEERQAKQYEEWFKNVAHGRDNPLVREK